jgi:hypothetical protein
MMVNMTSLLLLLPGAQARAESLSALCRAALRPVHCQGIDGHGVPVLTPPSCSREELQAYCKRGDLQEISIQCSFAGRLLHPASSHCICRAPWIGARCSELPTPPHRRTDATYAAALGGASRQPWVVAQCAPPGTTDTSDCTDGLNAALASPPGSTVFVPRLTTTSPEGFSSSGTAVGTPWNVRGVDFGGSNLRVVFEAGVIIQAKHNTTYLFACETISDLAVMHGLTNVSVAGYGATFRMWREIYVAQCKHSEFRMALAIQRSRGIQIAGLTISHAGGDGLIVMGDGKPGPGVDATVGLTLRDMILDRNYRQGISVISVVNSACGEYDAE